MVRERFHFTLARVPDDTHPRLHEKSIASHLSRAPSRICPHPPRGTPYLAAQLTEPRTMPTQRPITIRIPPCPPITPTTRTHAPSPVSPEQQKTHSTLSSTLRPLLVRSEARSAVSLLPNDCEEVVYHAPSGTLHVNHRHVVPRSRDAAYIPSRAGQLGRLALDGVVLRWIPYEDEDDSHAVVY
ncbi:hypothetical protein PMIN01_04721 [Paraphaeosphaeria minitans]|uniref:Uncharacterized protein n=1 Tax=Paraphaeosphaeria minitans TaxID=565426 RepID=A0A9P6KS60_9PLEO|nr:hypothetical protein PMIN01_04721 [Paraphaeosphaeria minitans]